MALLARLALWPTGAGRGLRVSDRLAGDRMAQVMDQAAQDLAPHSMAGKYSGCSTK